MKTRLAISAIAAALTGFICAALAEREGDPAAVIAEVEERLAELSPLRAEFAPPTEQGAAGVSRRELLNQLRAEQGPMESPRFTKLFRESQTEERLHWPQLERLWQHLTWQNKRTAEAKAMLHYYRNPAQFESGTWENRVFLAARPWEI